MQFAFGHHGFLGSSGKLHHAVGIIGLGGSGSQRTAKGHQVVRILNHVVAKDIARQRASGQFAVKGQIQCGLEQEQIAFPGLVTKLPVWCCMQKPPIASKHQAMRQRDRRWRAQCRCCARK